MNTNQRSGQTALSDLASKIMQPSEQNKAKTKRNKWKPEYARFKLKCYYKDGNTSVHYSYDMYHKYEAGIKRHVTDENEGVTKLFTYILSVQHKIKTCIVWVTFEKEKGTETARYNNEVYKGVTRNGTFISERPVKLIFENGKLNTFNLQKHFAELQKGGHDASKY